MLKKIITIAFVAGLLTALPAFASWRFAQNGPQPEQVQLPEGQDMNQDVQNKLNIMLDIMRGTYMGPRDVNLSISEDELNEVILPEVNRRVEEKDMLIGFSLDKATIPDGTLELSGKIMGRKTVDFSVSVSAMQRGGKVRLEVTNVKYDGQDVPREKLDQIIRAKGMKPENMMIGMRNFRVDDLRIRDNQIMISGRYTGAEAQQ